MIKHTWFLVVALLFVGVSIAFGQDAGITSVAVPVVEAEPVTAAGKGLAGVVEIVFYVVGLGLAALFGKFLLALERKTKFDVPPAWEAELMKLIPKGVSYAEEQAHKLVKAKTGSLAAPEKMEVAMNFVLDMAEQRKVKDLGKEKLKMLIESWLNENKRA